MGQAGGHAGVSAAAHRIFRDVHGRSKGAGIDRARASAGQAEDGDSGQSQGVAQLRHGRQVGPQAVDKRRAVQLNGQPYRADINAERDRLGRQVQPKGCGQLGMAGWITGRDRGRRGLDEQVAGVARPLDAHGQQTGLTLLNKV